MLENEKFPDFLARLKNQKILNIPAKRGQTAENRTAENGGLEMTAEFAGILAETEIYKARLVLAHLESKRNAETVIDADDFDETDFGVFSPNPLNVQFFPDSELTDDFDFENQENEPDENNDFDEDDF